MDLHPDLLANMIRKDKDCPIRLEDYCTVKRVFFPIDDTLIIDAAAIGSDWKKLETCQDCAFFGVWFNEKTFQILSYCEGDLTLQSSADYDGFVIVFTETDDYYQNLA